MNDRDSAIPAFDDASRALAHAMVDLVFDHIGGIAAQPVVEWSAAADMRALVRLDAEPAKPLALARLAARYAIQLHHPSFMGHQVCPPFPLAILGDLLV